MKAFSSAEVAAMFRLLVGLRVSLPWKGIGTAIFLELGELALPKPKARLGRGEACIMIEWDWRVEIGTVVAFGSSMAMPRIQEAIISLTGLQIAEIAIQGTIPELVIRFSNDQVLRTMVMAPGEAEWAIRLPDAVWIRPESGRIVTGGEDSSITLEEKAAYALAEETAARWGVPCVEPKPGCCGNCAWFVRLDGEGSLLDYGCCIAAGGPFDGRAVARASGCPAFTTC